MYMKNDTCLINISIHKICFLCRLEGHEICCTNASEKCSIGLDCSYDVDSTFLYMNTTCIVMRVISALLLGVQKLRILIKSN